MTGNNAARLVIGTLGVGLALLLAGCSGETGTAKPAPTSETSATTTGGSSSTPSTSSSGDSSALAKIDPCTLMTAGEAGELGVSTPGTKDSLAGDPLCDWKVSGSFGVLVGISAKEGIADLNLSGKTPIPLSLTKHKAGKLPNGSSTLSDSGLCAVLIEVSASSHVSVEVSTVGSRGTDLACQRAEQVAKFIDPKLP